MWPFDRLRARRYERRYNAALIVFLGAYQFARLDSAETARVEAEMIADLNRSGEPAVFWKRNAPWYNIAVFRAAAMDRVGIPSPIPDLSWARLFKPWELWSNLPQWPMPRCDLRVFSALLAFHVMDRATQDARKFLIAKGIDIAAADELEEARQASCNKQWRVADYDIK